jgi:hypothetical protein
MENWLAFAQWTAKFRIRWQGVSRPTDKTRHFKDQFLQWVFEVLCLTIKDSPIISIIEWDQENSRTWHCVDAQRMDYFTNMSTFILKLLNSYNLSKIAYIQNKFPLILSTKISHSGYYKYRVRNSYYVLSFNGRCTIYWDMFRFNRTILKQYAYDFTKTIIPATDPLFLGFN